jgi:hypothetical protein
VRLNGPGNMNGLLVAIRQRNWQEEMLYWRGMPTPKPAAPATARSAGPIAERRKSAILSIVDDTTLVRYPRVQRWFKRN